MQKERIFLGLGGNVGPILRHFEKAIEDLMKLPDARVVKCSPLYITKPIGYENQPSFTNAVIEMTCTLIPEQLLDELLRIELRCGRKRYRKERNMPRTLDLDLLLYGERYMNTASLQLPHPRISERRFVLEPLAAIDPALHIRSLSSLKKMLENLPHQDVIKAGDIRKDEKTGGYQCYMSL